jgi:transglutaminase-like putative cysteine protease
MNRQETRTALHPSPLHRRPRPYLRDAVLAILALGACLALPVVMVASGWLPIDAAPLYRLCLLAWASAIALTALQTPDSASRGLGILLGLVAGAELAARVLPSPRMIGSDIERMASWLWHLAIGDTTVHDFPLSYTAGHLYWQTRALAERLGLWAANVRQGIPNTDNTALLFASGVGIWVLSSNGTQELVARRRALAGLLPIAMAVGANVYLGHLPDSYLYAYLGVLLVTLVWANVSRMEDRWLRAGLSPRRPFRWTTLLAGLLLGTLALSASALAPNATFAWTFHTFWQEHGSRIEAFYRRLDDAFAGRNPLTHRAEAQASVVTVNVLEISVTPTPPTARLPGHTIGDGADLGTDPVMWVTIDQPTSGATQGPAPQPKYYLRERTYDTYTGRGWTNGPTTSSSLDAETPWTSVDGRHTVVRQHYTLLRPSAYAFGVNEPVSLSTVATLLTREPGDLVALMTSAESYTVTSHVPDVTIAALRNAEGDYPPLVRERYIALPPLPERVRAEAFRIISAAGASTRYDQARAIEAYLRGLTYDLEAPAPPPDADVVDHFLFETRAGFCDHSASAMVVLLRSLGIAARYVSGYGMGTYHPEQGAWLVTSANAHAWVEVYFPGIGWVEFEPTPAESPIQRPESRPTRDPTAAPRITPVPQGAEPAHDGPSESAAAPHSGLRDVTRWTAWLGAIAGAVILCVVALWRSRWRLGNDASPRLKIVRIYRRLSVLGRWLGVDSRGATPREALAALQHTLQQRLGSEVEVGKLAPLYERAQYGSAPVTRVDADDAVTLWRALRTSMVRRIWRLLGRGGRR